MIWVTHKFTGLVGHRNQTKFFLGLSPLLVKLPQILEWILLDSLLKAAVIPFAGATFPSTLFSFHSAFCEYAWIQHSITTSFFSNYLLWLILFVEGVSNRFYTGQ